MEKHIADARSSLQHHLDGVELCEAKLEVAELYLSCLNALEE